MDFPLRERDVFWQHGQCLKLLDYLDQTRKYLCWLWIVVVYQPFFCELQYVLVSDCKPDFPQDTDTVEFKRVHLDEMLNRSRETWRCGRESVDNNNCGKRLDQIELIGSWLLSVIKKKHSTNSYQGRSRESLMRRFASHNCSLLLPKGRHGNRQSWI